MTRILKAIVLFSFLLSGCASVFRGVTITDIDISPQTLPPDGDKVKIVVKTYNAEYVRIYFKRESDGKNFRQRPFNRVLAWYSVWRTEVGRGNHSVPQ